MNWSFKKTCFGIKKSYGKNKIQKKKKQLAPVGPDKFPYDKYKIWWTDPCGDTGWASATEFDKMTYSEPYSEAWVYKKDKKVLKYFLVMIETQMGNNFWR